MNGRWAIMKSSVILEERLITASHASIVGRTQTQVLLLARWNTHEGFISCAQCWTTLHECPLWGKRWFPSQHTPNRIPGQVVSGDQLWKPESGKYVSPLLHTRNLLQGRGDIKGQGKYKSVCSPDKHCLKTRLFWCVFSDPERHGNVLSLSTKMTLNGTLPMLLQDFQKTPRHGAWCTNSVWEGLQAYMGEGGPPDRKWGRGLNQTHLLLSIGGLYRPEAG